MKLNIVLTDCATVSSGDLDLSVLEQFGNVTYYPETSPDQTAERIKDADVVVTGEGRLDGQTVMGKAPIGVARIAKKYDKTVIAFCGTASPDAVKCNDHGIDAFFPVLQKPCTLSEAMDETNAYNNLASTAEQAFRLIRRISSEGRS